MIELLLLKSLATRDLYRKYRHVVKVSEELQPLLEKWDMWYRYNTEDPKIEDLAVLIEIGEDHNKDYLHDALGKVWSHETPKDIITLLEHAKTAQIAQKLALEAYRVSEGEGSVSELLRLTAELGRGNDASGQTEFVSQGLGEILQSTTGTPGLRWRLPWLNQSLGSLRKGDFGFIFARPETGKTTFLASECTHFASQASGPIIWFNNEEQGEKVKLRCYQAALGATVKQLQQDVDGAERLYAKRGGNKIMIVDDAGMDARKAESIVSMHNPSMVVFDQIDKIKGFKNDREDLALGAIYQWARELAKSYCPIIGVCQASGEAEGEPYLHMGHVANARTAKQAEADFMLGIGKTHQPGGDSLRYFNICKNKLVGDSDSDPACRHGRATMIIKPETARYEES